MIWSSWDGAVPGSAGGHAFPYWTGSGREVPYSSPCYPPASPDVPNGEREPGRRLMDTGHALLIPVPGDCTIPGVYDVS